MPDLTFTGIGSGLQVSEIVEAIVGAETAPFVSRSNRKEAEITTDISAVGALKSALESVSQAISGLANADDYQQRTASGADSFIGLSADKNTQVGSFSIEVNSLAQSQKLMSEAIAETESVGEGELTVAVAGASFNVAVSATDTLSDIRDAINTNVDNEAVTATIITDDVGQRLVITSNETGLANAITTSVNDLNDSNNTDNNGLSRLAYDSDNLSATFANNLTEVTAALDAQISIDGSVVVTNSNNVFENVIDGVTVTAKKIHKVDDDISQIRFAEDNRNIETGLNQFVESYNELLTLSKDLGRAGETGSGPLAGDSILRGVMGKLRQKLSESFVVGNGQSLSLNELGVRADRFGVLSLDSADLNAAIASDVTAVQQFFVGTSNSDGFASSLTTLTKFYTDTGGIIQNRIDSRTTQLDRLDDDRINFERKITALEERLFAQYNAMDLLVSNLNATSSYLQTQLDNLPGVVRKSDN
jgi:flagellar hook-associated protein 2